MPTLTCLPDDRLVPIREGETILEAALRADLPIAHVCGGRARCSTCRVRILEGLEHCGARASDEQALTGPLGFGPDLRLACQTRVEGDVTLRRLVLDDTDVEIASQLSRQRLGPAGTSKEVTVLFSDIREFTRLSQRLSAYDVMYLLNRYFHRIGDAIENNGGYVVDYFGDGVMALFGIEDDPLAPLRGIKAALDIMEIAHGFQPYVATMYGQAFAVGVGLHYGPAVIGVIGSAGNQKLTGIGDTVNIANRVETANKEFGTPMLISDALLRQVAGQVTVGAPREFLPKGSSEPLTLFEVRSLSRSGAELLASQSTDRTRRRHGGRDWIRLLPQSQLPPGGKAVVELDELDVLLVRTADQIHALNNACPHLRLPLRDGTVTETGEIVCPWHESSFDLRTGEIITWCPVLAPDGTIDGLENLGNVSKNRMPVLPLPVDLVDDHIWVAVGSRPS